MASDRSIIEWSYSLFVFIIFRNVFNRETSDQSSDGQKVRWNDGWTIWGENSRPINYRTTKDDGIKSRNSNNRIAHGCLFNNGNNERWQDQCSSEREQFVFRIFILYYLSVIRQEDVPSLATRETIGEKKRRARTEHARTPWNNYRQLNRTCFTRWIAAFTRWTLYTRYVTPPPCLLLKIKMRNICSSS